MKPERLLWLGTSACVLLVSGFLYCQKDHQADRSAQVVASASTTSSYRKVASDSTLSFAVPSDLEPRSVLENIALPDGLTGALSLHQNRLTFKPTAPLSEGNTYVLTVKDTTQRRDGRPLDKTLTYTFEVAGPPQVVSRLPSPDSERVPPDATITMTFDRPMVPLTTIHDRPMLDESTWPVTIQPPLRGEWHWISTTTVEFRPSSTLTPATKYIIAVPPGLASHDGGKTSEAFSWQFATERLRVITSEPRAGSEEAGPDTQVTLTFNLPVDLAAAKELIKFKVGEADVPIKEITYGKTDDGTEKPEQIVIVPATSLLKETKYTVFIPAALKSHAGTLTMREEKILHFTTVGDFMVKDSQHNYGTVSINFNNPLPDDEAAIIEYLSIEPAIEGFGADDISVNMWGNGRELDIYATTKPSTEYTVTVASGLTDRFGQPLAEDYTFTFTTPPLDPEVFIHSRGEFGIFERDKPPVYYLNAVNVKRLDVKLHKLSLQEFLALRQKTQEDWNFKPDRDSLEQVGQWVVDLSEQPGDTWHSEAFDLEAKTDRLLQSGIYLLTVESPDYRNNWLDNEPYLLQQFFTLTNTALALKYTGSSTLVWAVDMQTGDPIAGADIAFHSLVGETVVRATTDDFGFAEANVAQDRFVTPDNDWLPEFWVTALNGSDFAFVGSRWDGGISPYNFDIEEDFWGVDTAPQKVEAFLYTDRPIYRAGQEVHFKALLRLRDYRGSFQIPSDRQALVEVRDAKGKEIYSETLPINEFGSVHGTVPLAEAASLGDYNLSLSLVPDAGLAPHYLDHDFYVLAYRKPEYEVTVDFAQPHYAGSSTIEATIGGRYFFGAPMSDAKVQWRAMSLDYYFNKYTDGWYSFALDNRWCFWDWQCDRESDFIVSGKGALSTEGKLEVSFPFSLDDKGLSQVVSLEADITDRNNQVVSHRESVPVHSADLYVGIKPQTYVVQPNESATVDLIAVDVDGTPQADQKITVKLFKREWNTVRKKSVDGDFYYDNEPEDTFLRETTVRTGSGGKTTATLRVDSGGSYRLVASSVDAEDNLAQAGTSVYSWSTTYVNWPRQNNDRLELQPDLPEYSVGDTADVLIQSPYQGEGVSALVTVEREEILRQQIVPIESSAQILPIEITADMIPNAFVSVVLVKPRQGETFNEHGKDTGAPAFKVGYAQLNVETSPKAITVDLQTDKQQYGPGETVDVTMQLRDDQGEPLQGEVSLAVVDMSVLALTGFKLPDPLGHFYRKRGLGVRTSHMLLYLLERFKPGTKGGGGGDPATKERGNFKDTAFWAPSLIANADGIARASFTLPDNLTTWKLVAIAHAKDHRFGAQETEIIETKSVIVRPVRPRFAVHGDEIDLSAIVHNFLPEEQSFRVALNGSGFTATDATEHTVTIPANGQVKLHFPVTIHEQIDQASFRFAAHTTGAQDVITETIPVHPFGVEQSVATSGTVDQTQTETIFVPKPEHATRPTLTTTISPSLASYLPGGLEHLVTFPYGCAEQTVSSFLPNIALAQLTSFEAFSVVNEAELQDMITRGLTRLYRFQRSDGGFGYWSGSRHSYPYLTAYIVWALQETQAAGHTVDNMTLSRAQEYLEKSLREQDLDNVIDRAERAYILFVLAEGGKPDPSALAQLAKRREELPLFAQAHLAMGLMSAQDSVSAQLADTIMQELLNHVVVDARGAHLDEANPRGYRRLMHTNTRTNAIVVQALARHDPNHPLLPKLVRYLLHIREHGHWDTTQSTVATLLAFVEYLDASGELSGAFVTDVVLNDQVMETLSFSADNILTQAKRTLTTDELKTGAPNTLTMNKTGTGRLFYDLLFTYFSTTDVIPAAEEGIGITKAMELVDGTDMTVGSTHRVTLTISVPEDRHFVAVESPLPGGLEAIDLRLKTSQQDRLAEEANHYDSWRDRWESGLRHFTHIEFRDDRVFLFADKLPAGVYKYEYLVRATTPGRFRERPARAWEMYFPEVFGQTKGGWFAIEY